MTLGDGWDVGLGPTTVAGWVDEEGGWSGVGWETLGCWEKDMRGGASTGAALAGPSSPFCPWCSGSEAIGHFSVPIAASAPTDLGLKAGSPGMDGIKDTSDKDDPMQPRLSIPRSPPQQDSTNSGLSTGPSTRADPLPSLQASSALVTQLCHLRMETGR